MQLIIPMSGMGNRFIEAGYKQPKPLIEVDGMPIIQHVLNLFPGVEDVTFICNSKHLKETEMRSILERVCPKGRIVEKEYSHKGPVDAVISAFGTIKEDEEVIVSYCDYSSVWNFSDFVRDARSTSAEGSIACYRGFHPHMLGSDKYAFCREQNNFLLEIREKECFTENKMDEYASNGTYYFKTGATMKKYFTELVEKNIHVNGEHYVSLVYNLLVRDGLPVRIFEIQKMLQWGTPDDLRNYQYWSSYFKDIRKPHTKFDHKEDVVTVMPMAGRGSRFSDIGYNTPKPLIEVNGEPMVVKAVNCLPQSNKNVFICLQSHCESYEIERVLLENYKHASVVKIQDTTDGQATTCKIGIESANVKQDQPILISACDNGVYYNTEAYKSLYEDTNVDVIVWSFRNNQTTKHNPNMYSYLDVDQSGFVKEVSVKKLKYGTPLNTHAIIGTMFFRKAEYFLGGYEQNKLMGITTNGEFYVDDVINRCIENGLRVKCFEVEKYICWGTPNDYLTYNYWKDHFDTILTHQ